MKERILFVGVLIQFMIICDGAGLRSFVDRSTPLSIPEGWRRLRSAPSYHEITFRIAIKLRNMELFDKIFWEVTDPESVTYGNYLSLAEVNHLVSPDKSTIAAVEQWLNQEGVCPDRAITMRGDYITCKMKVEEAQNVLQAHFFTWRHEESKMEVVRSLGPYTAPAAITQNIDFIIGGIGLPATPAMAQKLHPTNLNKLKEIVPVTPHVIRQRYNITVNAFGGSLYNSQSAAEFGTNYFTPADVSKFYDLFWTGRNYTNQVSQTVGTNDASQPSIQASVDLQYLMGVAPDVPTWYWSVQQGNADFWTDLSEWQSQVSQSPNPPYVHTIGYGNQGVAPSEQYQDRVSQEFEILGARGLTILVATGDSGTGCSLCWYYEPSFPSTSPFVTAVGSTRFLNGAVGPEGATETLHSGGGFSWHFPIPSYQTHSVNNYFTSNGNLPQTHFYNRDGRGIPDISALGVAYQYIIGTSTQYYDGTAAATVTVGGMISLLNEIRLVHNRPVLGFLNVWLYGQVQNYNSALYDVLDGSNHAGCCGFSGFYADKGWDPVTGLGTPNFEVLRKIV